MSRLGFVERLYDGYTEIPGYILQMGDLFLVQNMSFPADSMTHSTFINAVCSIMPLMGTA
jgi:hypothetical protein